MASLLRSTRLLLVFCRCFSRQHGCRRSTNPSVVVLLALLLWLEGLWGAPPAPLLRVLRPIPFGVGVIRDVSLFWGGVKLPAPNLLSCGLPQQIPQAVQQVARWVAESCLPLQRTWEPRSLSISFRNQRYFPYFALTFFPWRGFWDDCAPEWPVSQAPPLIPCLYNPGLQPQRTATYIRMCQYSQLCSRYV